ncbi:MAG: GBS Bsp-like repeat-containing protein [Lachnospiraceae bacterium]|nr:GBS Bsp-like repeat-containing protein [Lachnospiraceae bacterium]
MFKRRLAAILSAAMVFTTVAPYAAFADDETGITSVSVEEDASESEDATIEDKELSTDTTEETVDKTESDEEETGAEESKTESEEEPAEEEKTEEEKPVVTPGIKAELNEDETKILITATGIDENATNVVFPTWSAKNGQDDLEWVKGVKQEDGTYTAEVIVKKHKSVGTYFIHCYQTVAGKQTFFAKDEVELTAPSGTVLVENLDEVKGHFTVRITDLNVPSGIVKLEVPTWGDESGQNDLVWHQAVKDGEDYTVEVDANQHLYENGLYQIHCYVIDGNGNQSFIDKTTATLNLETGMKAELSEDEKTIKVTAIGINSAATNVVFPTWSTKNGQDDLKWINGTKVNPRTWVADIPVKGHKDPGEYQIHCYQTAAGKQTFFAKDFVNVTAATGTVAAATPDPETGAFEVSVSDLNAPAGVKEVVFAVWGSADGQNDLVWHTGVKKGDSYVATVTPGQHKFEDGIYNVHCYVKDTNDIQVFAGAATPEVTLKEGLTAVVSADQKTAQIQYIGPKAKEALKVAVWSNKGSQDDLVWYNMTQNGNGATVSVPISNHKTEGEYPVHLYTKANKFVDKTSFEIDPIGSATVTVSALNGNKGTFKVTISGLSTPSGVSKVSVPVWPNGDQSKINWYTATKSGDNYVATVSVDKHKNTFGRFDVHVYGYANNGVNGFVGATTAELKADRYVYSEKTGTYTTRVWILNPGTDATGVTFKAWSNSNGQDDVVSYTGVKSGDNYYADIKSAKHKHGGNYTTEVYVNANGSSALAGTASFSMPKEGEAKNQQMYNYAQGFSSDTEYLILVNRALHRVAVYQGSHNNWKEIKYWPCVVGKPSTPTPTGTYKIKGRFNYFGDGHLCWWCTQIEGYYYFHTVIYYTDVAPIRILDGTMDAAASMGCIRLDEPNARWIYTTVPRGTTVHIYN